MKEYTTLEVLEALFENNGLQFSEVIYPKSDTTRDCNILCVTNGGQYVWKSTLAPFKLTNGNLGRKWTKVQQPVPFIEAVKAYHEGKSFEVKINNISYVYTPCLENKCDYGYELKDEHNSISSGEILNGVCYILD